MSLNGESYNISAPLRPLRPLVRDAYRGALGANQEFLSCATRVQRVDGKSERTITRMVAYADRQLPQLSGLMQCPFYADEKVSSLFYFPGTNRGRWMLGINTLLDEFETEGAPWNRLRSSYNRFETLDQGQMEKLLSLTNGLCQELLGQVIREISERRDSLRPDELPAFDTTFGAIKYSYHTSLELSKIALENLRDPGHDASQDPIQALIDTLAGFNGNADAWGLTQQHARYRLANPATDGRDRSGREFGELVGFDMELQKIGIDPGYFEALDSPSMVYPTAYQIGNLHNLLESGDFCAANQSHKNLLHYLVCILIGIKDSIAYAQQLKTISPKRFSGEVCDIPLEGVGVFFDRKKSASEFVPGLCRSIDFGIGQTSSQLQWNETAINTLVNGFEGGVNGIYLVSRSYSGNPSAAVASAYFDALMNLRVQDAPLAFVRMLVVKGDNAASISARCFEASPAVLDYRPPVFPLAGVFEAFTASTSLGREADDLYFELNRAAVTAEKIVYEKIRDARIAKKLDIDSMHNRPYDEIQLLNGESGVIEDFIRNALPKIFASVASSALDRPGNAVLDELRTRLVELGAEMADRYRSDIKSPARSAAAATRRMQNSESTFVYTFSCAAMQLVSEYLVAEEMIGAHLEERPVVFADQPGVGPKTTPDTAPARVSFAQAQAQQRQEAKARRTEARAEAQRMQQEQERERLLDEAAQKAIANPFEAFAAHAAAKRTVVAEALRSEIAGSVKDISDMKALKEKLNGIWVSTDEFLQELRLCDEQAKNRPIEVRMARLIEATVNNILRQMEEEEAPLVDNSGQTETLSPNNDAIFTREVTVIKNAIINRKISPRKWLEIQNKAIEYMGLFPWYNPRFMISNLATLISNGEWADGIIEYLDTSIEEQQGLRAAFYGSYFLGDDPLTSYLIPTEEEEKANSPE